MGGSAEGRVLETERLALRRLTVDDAPFMLRLLNEPSWLRYIGDRGVRTLDDARRYILEGPVAMYERLGFGLYATALREDDSVPIGICGLVKRAGLDDVDIGFALLPEHWGKGYAYEAASAVMGYAKSVVGLTRIVAITSLDNESSARLLGKIGLRFERLIRLTEGGEEVRLFAWDVGSTLKS
ncbi:MAG TPA: GNAT family N-acetyltransferase [Thermoanaerobaculia bacterium]|nr:GNAT family N-acetyltransferase [Thermoanaerobaculia bacterium]